MSDAHVFGSDRSQEPAGRRPDAGPRNVIGRL